MNDDPMFEFDVETVHIRKGTRVVVHTIYGEVAGVVRKLNHDREGYPQARIKLNNGNDMTIGIGRLSPAPDAEPDPTDEGDQADPRD